MKADKEKEEKLRKLLVSAYGTRNDFEPDGGWERRVMARVTEMMLLSQKPAFFPAFEHFVWKLAPAALAICAALTALLSWRVFWAGPDGIQLLSNYFEELPLWRIFGA
jgi:hypothetical protein